MKEQLIEFQTARLAKERGFNMLLWDGKEETLKYKPAQSLLQKWLRENHDTHVGIVLGENFWNCNLYKVKSGQYLDTVFNKGNHAFDSYEQALEQGLYEALELIEV